MTKLEKALADLFDLRIEYVLNEVDLPRALEEAIDNLVRAVLRPPICPMPWKEAYKAILAVREIYLKKGVAPSRELKELIAILHWRTELGKPRKRRVIRRRFFFAEGEDKKVNKEASRSASAAQEGKKGDWNCA